MAKWNRRQFLNGLLAAAGADATVMARDAFAFTPPQEGQDATAEPATSDPAVAAGATANAAETSGEASSGTTPAPYGTTHAPDGTTHDLQRMLPAGLEFGRWRIVEVQPVKFGAVPVILETRRGSRFQVDILRRDRRGHAKRGIAETRLYSLYLANLGRGMKPTREDHGVGLLWLAALMRPREFFYDRPALLSLRERLIHFPGGRFDALAASRPPVTRG